jgi:EF-P beta-lysylation protein EpmB
LRAGNADRTVVTPANRESAIDNQTEILRPAAAWQQELAEAVRDPDALIDRLGLPETLRAAARQAAELFPLFVTESFLRRMQPGDPGDPLLLQVLPLAAESHSPPAFVTDPLEEAAAHRAPGLLQKYAGRALMIATGVCAIHCRYCFRRSFPYGDEPRRLADWEPAFEQLRADTSIREIILSGGDPLMLSDARLAEIIARLDAIEHLDRLRIHTRLPVVLPARVTSRLLELLRSTRMTPIVVVHANHPAEIDGDCRDALRLMVTSGLTVLNQTVLLAGINDTVEALAELSLRLINVGVIPYYLHQLDRVAGTAHFEVPPQQGLELIAELRRRLPGYAVPQYVREVPGTSHKVPLT